VIPRTFHGMMGFPRSKCAMHGRDQPSLPKLSTR
jgi:hypothetical protein